MNESKKDYSQSTPSRIRWNQVNGNPFLRKLHPLMLTQKGLIDLRNTTLYNDPNGTPKKLYEVVYDEWYVYQKISNDLIRPLAIQDFNSLQKLISKAWTFYQKGNR